MRIVLGSIVCGLAILTGCAAGDPEGDVDATESELVAKDKLTGIAQNSPEAAGILKAASTLSAAELGFCVAGEACRDLDHAFLDASQVGRMMAYRAGLDGKAGTKDDRAFRSLSVLRRETALAGVTDQFTFQSLLSVAMHRGYAYPYVAAKVLAIADGSREAAAMLRVANTFDRDHLGFGPSGASYTYMNWWVADAIVDHRAGADGQLGTKDDQAFTSLAQLKQVALSHAVLAHVVGPAEEPAEMAFNLAQLARMGGCGATTE
jgi:hypothetical protein